MSVLSPSAASQSTPPATITPAPTPWQYYVATIGTLAGLVNSVANYVFGNKKQATVNFVIAGLSFFAAYTIKNLTLTKQEAAEIETFQKTDQDYEKQAENLGKENQKLRVDLITLKEVIENLEKKNHQIDELSTQLNQGDEVTKKQIATLQEQNKDLTKNVTELNTTLEQLKEEKSSIETLVETQLQNLIKSGKENESLKVNLEAYKTTIEELNLKEEKFKDENKNLQIQIGNMKKSVNNLNERLQKETQELKETNEKLKSEKIDLATQIEELKEELKKKEELVKRLVDGENKLESLLNAGGELNVEHQPAIEGNEQKTQVLEKAPKEESLASEKETKTADTHDKPAEVAREIEQQNQVIVIPSGLAYTLPAPTLIKEVAPPVVGVVHEVNEAHHHGHHPSSTTTAHVHHSHHAGGSPHLGNFLHKVEDLVHPRTHSRSPSPSRTAPHDSKKQSQNNPQIDSSNRETKTDNDAS